MDRLLIHVEGQTEELFVREVLAPYLVSIGYSNVSARLMGNARQRNFRGGVRSWSEVRRDILNHLREDGGCVSALMVDFYGMPAEGTKAWPGRAEAGSAPFAGKVAAVTSALSDDIASAMGHGFKKTRFVPGVVIHEFEALLFSDCNVLADCLGGDGLAAGLQHIRDSFRTPEEINDSPVTAPSKRISALVPSYQKPINGVIAALEIGLDRIRAECQNFSEWVSGLELAVR